MAKRRARGEGSIFKEASTDYWRAYVTLPDGSRKYKRSKSQQVVKDWLLQQRQAMRDSLLLSDERLTIGDYLDRFMSDVAAHTLAPSTIRSYSYLIRDHIVPEIGRIRLANLRPDHLQSLYSKKLKAGLSRRTVQYIHAIIRRSLNEAVRWGLIHRNPTDAVTPPRPKKAPPQTLSIEQAKLYLKSVEEHHYFPIYMLAIMNGMRKGELLGLHWEDVDLDDETISIKHALITIQGKSHIGEPKSSTAKRTIAIPEVICTALREYDSDKEGLVFKTPSGKPISQRNLTRHFHKSLESIGCEKMPFHNLRHTAATILLQAKVHPKIVQEMLGHSTITLTLDTYSHVIPGIQKEAADSMDRLFK